MSELEVVKGKRKFFTKRRVIIGVISIILISFFYNMGSSTAKIELDKEKVGYEDLVSKIKKKELELKDVGSKVSDAESKLKEIDSKYAEREEEFNKALEVVANIDKSKGELDGVNSELNRKNTELTKVNGEIAEANTRLEKAKTGITQAEGQPKELVAGQYNVGTDVPAGRYQVTNIGRGTNFFVYQGGYAVVNTILGDGMVGSGDYVFFAEDGQIIETHGKVRLTPVK